jgi:membrane protease YdiL (CAAX protease family)
LSFLELTLTFLNYFFDQLSIPPSFSSPYDDYLGNPSNAIIFAFLVMCIGPIFEEIVFRKHVSYFLESNISSKLFVIFLTGVIFSLNHLPADLLNGSFRFTLEHLYVVFILGLVLGVIYYNYGLFYSILFHSLWNSFTFLTQNENLIPDPVLLSNLLFVLGLISIIILPGIIVYKEKEKVTNMKNSLCDRLSSKKLSLSVFTNTLAIITYEFLVAILLVTYQSVLSTLLLLGIHSLGIILGFIVLDIDLRTSNNFQEQ